MRAKHIHRAQGFTLVEVMVAVVVICVGLLGIAKMQALALNNMSTSRLRSLAAIEAASLAAAMHSNRAYWGTTPPTTATLTPVSEAFASSDAALAAAVTADFATKPANACVGTSGSGAMCAAAVNLAGFDVALWTQDLENLLPNAGANIACVSGPPPSCTIQINWTEQAVSVNSQESAYQQTGATGQFETPTYTLYVEP